MRVRTRIFHQFVFNSAKRSGEPLTEYRKWLTAVTTAVQTAGSPPTSGSELIVNAQAELKLYMQQIQDTKDIEKLAAIKERTELGSLGRILVDGFKDQSPSIRAAAANAIADDIGVPRFDRKLPPAIFLIGTAFIRIG